MKTKIYACFMACMSILFIACSSSSDDNGDDNGKTGGTLSETITQRSCSLQEGVEVSAEQVTSITVTYNTTVKVSANAKITLNGTTLTAKSSASTKMAIEIPVTLDEGTNYTLTIPSGSVLAIADETRTAPAFTLNFSTAKPVETNPGNIDALCDASATDAAKNLYNLLLQNYGKKMFSSVIADVNWNHKIADQIYQKTGKYPAFNCYDFIQIYVPSGNGWINYDDITPVTEWADAGGLVQLMWHFNVPLSQTTTVGKDGSGVTCTPSETTFRASNALKDGTWENKWFYQEMDKVIAVLQKLQDKNIAAVWRPFHEAAGNATLKSGASWGKSWFWWGYDGAEVYKNLWKTMYSYFQQKGIHNLIWVWTTQNYNGDSTTYNADTDWYPGNEYVDIIGRDLYGNTAAQNKTEFEQIAARYPNKMVALAECGSNGNTAFANMSDVWSGGAKWAWFMPWYGSSLPTDTWWKNAMSNANVLTRSDISK